METRVSKNKKQLKEDKKRVKNKRKERLKKSRTKIRLIILSIITLFVIYGLFIEPRILLVNEVKLESKDIPNSFDGIKIVHFSDLHYGNTININNIDKVITKINSLKPDIVIFTGDLIDNKYNMTKEDTTKLTKSLKKINYNLGKYAVLGNHDFYKDEFNNIMYDSDFTLLKNSYDTVYNKDNNPILIYGVDNVTYGSPSLTGLDKKELENISYKILLVHEPDYIDNILNKYDIDLILSGHSHNGQIKLFGLKPFYKPDGSKKYFSPHYKENNTDIYISNGIGTSIIQFRFGSIPSINLYRLNSQNWLFFYIKKLLKSS